MHFRLATFSCRRMLGSPGTAQSQSFDGIITIGTEPERPQQSGRGNLPVDFAIAIAVAHLHLVIRRNGAPELWRASAQGVLRVVAGNGFAGHEHLFSLRPDLHVHGWDVCRRPHVRPTNRSDSLL